MIDRVFNAIRGGTPEERAAKNAIKAAQETAKETVERYIEQLGIKDIGVYFAEEQPNSFALIIRRTETAGMFANAMDVYAAGKLADNSQQMGFALGQLASEIDRTSSVRVGYNYIQAPTPEILTDFINNQMARGRT